MAQRSAESARRLSLTLHWTFTVQWFRHTLSNAITHWQIERQTVNEKGQAQSGTHTLQRDEGREIEKQKLRQKIRSIREGHTTGGYCDSEALKVEEKKLDKILRAELKEAIDRHGYSPDPRFKAKEVRDIEVELNGLSWKPTLVVKED